MDGLAILTISLVACYDEMSNFGVSQALESQSNFMIERALMSRGKIGVYHPGTQHSWQTALAFQEGGALAWFATSILYDETRFPYSVPRFLPGKIGRQLKTEFLRRDFPPLDKLLVEQFGLLEWLAVPLRRARLSNLARRASLASSAAGAKRVRRLLQRGNVEALWTFDAVGLEALRAAKDLGVPTVLDQTIGHMASLDRIMRNEAECHPEYFPEGFRGIPAAVIERQYEELEIADYVVVGSDFAKGTLVENGVAEAKIEVLRYGFDERLFTSASVRAVPRERPIRFLCVGSIGPRKGTPYLFEAFRNISPELAHLTIVGPLEVPPSLLPRDLPHVTVRSSVPRSEIPGMMLEADCAILPSLFEGCSISLHEAIASGLPLIHSISAGDGLVDGNGIVLGEVSAEAIHEAVETVLQDPSLIATWSRRSVESVNEHRASAYRGRVREFSKIWLS